MAFLLRYKATCEYCSESIETKATSPYKANAFFEKEGWQTIGNELDTSQHYCPFHAKHSRHDKKK